MAKVELNPGEVLLKQGKAVTFQGKKIKFLISSNYYITNQRFIYFDVGKKAALMVGLGPLARAFTRGNQVDIKIPGMKINRGNYAKNKNILQLTDDKNECLLLGYERWFKFIKDIIEQDAHMQITEIGEGSHEVSGTKH